MQSLASPTKLKGNFDVYVSQALLIFSKGPQEGTIIQVVLVG